MTKKNKPEEECSFIINKSTGVVAMVWETKYESGLCSCCKNFKSSAFLFLSNNKKNEELCLHCLKKNYIPVSF